jgi:hypothetical protein
MSQLQDTTIHKAGEIEVRQTRKGYGFYAFNHTHKKILCIGTIAGATYEKEAQVLQKPELSFCLPVAELNAVKAYDAQYIRIIPSNKSATYAISVTDFERFGEPFYNAFYGKQIRCALRYFQRSAKVVKRNPIIDNPPIETHDPLAHPHEQQPSLFEWRKVN